MESVGLQGRAMSSGIYPLLHTMKVAGPAFTVHCISTPSRDRKLHDIRLGMFLSMNKGCVQIRDTQGDVLCGQFGEISATAAHAAGCVGEKTIPTSRKYFIISKLEEQFQPGSPFSSHFFKTWFECF